MNVRKTSVCPTVFSANNQVEDDMVQEEVPDIVPHFQRVNISGEDITGDNSSILIPRIFNIDSLFCSGYSAEDLQLTSALLQEAITLRQRYMKMSRQSFSADCEHFLQSSSKGGGKVVVTNRDGEEMSLLDHQVHAPKSSGDHWECEVQPDLGYKLSVEQGVFQVFKTQEDLESRRPVNYQYPRLGEFVKDLQKMCSMISDGPLKTFCYKRLVYLSSKFQLHGLLNEIR